MGISTLISRDAHFCYNFNEAFLLIPPFLIDLSSDNNN